MDNDFYDCRTDLYIDYKSELLDHEFFDAQDTAGINSMTMVCKQSLFLRSDQLKIQTLGLTIHRTCHLEHTITKMSQTEKHDKIPERHIGCLRASNTVDSKAKSTGTHLKITLTKSS